MIKLSASYRFSPSSSEFLANLARELLACRPDRMVWGSDWPHTGGAENDRINPGTTQAFRGIDTGTLLDLLADWLPEDSLRRKVLAENAAELYGFDD